MSTDNELTPISLEESQRLLELEATIEKHIRSFLTAGAALAEIRDKRLYRVEHATFAEYCDAKWGISDRRARQLIDSVAIVESIGKSGTHVPVSEAQVRPLAKLEPKKRAEAFSLAVELAKGKEPTMDQVAQAVAQALEKPETIQVYVSEPEPKTRKVFQVHVSQSEPETPKVFHVSPKSCEEYVSEELDRVYSRAVTMARHQQLDEKEVLSFVDNWLLAKRFVASLENSTDSQKIDEQEEE
jgi:hypothetical protein